MTPKKHKGNKKYFQCEECLLYYKTKALAAQCKNFCRRHKSCNLKITKKAVTIH
ncbi:hypothetical protein J4421_05155 [Candidatus Woesearchaeota archaeon]|nr:hypothetical protein [Candidatus Woesearchaeota archaeon]